MADLGRLAKAQRLTSITQFISQAGVAESEHLVDVLGTIFEHVDASQNSSGSAQEFYSGVNQEWFPIENNLDVRRPIADRVTKRCIIRPADPVPKFYLIKGHAGSGKSVVLRRIAWDAAKDYGRLVLFLRAGQRIDVKALEEIEALTNLTVYLFIDDAGEHVDEIRHLLERAAVREWKLVIIGAERVNEWNMLQDDAGIEPDGEFALEYLSQPEIEDLVLLLEQHGSLGELEGLQLEERIEAFAERAGRQLLVALQEATKGESFDDILENEFRGISPLAARALYLDICALHRFGPPVRAGLISRVHGIGFEEFQHRFFLPLESVVLVTREKYTGDYLYQARHNYIAETVFHRVANSEPLRQEIVLRILDKINLDYSYDEVVLYELIRARGLAELFPTRLFGVSIYEAAVMAAGRTARLLHQWGLYEMRLARDRTGLDRAESLVREALSLESDLSTIRHSLAELAFRRSEVAKTDLEAAAFRQEAASIAKRLAGSGTSSHAHHTLAKVALANLSQSQKEEAQRPSELTTQAVNQAIQEAELVIRAGLSRFPNDIFLLSAEAQLAERLKNAKRALSALERAFANSTGSELIANRLAIMHQSNGDFGRALEVIKKALGQTPGSALLNLRYALIRMLAEPGLDADSPEILLHYFKRGYRGGAENSEFSVLVCEAALLGGAGSGGATCSC